MYGYHNETGELWVYAQNTKECPEIVDIMGIILGVIGAIVTIGLVLILMWKVFTTIHDRREFARFEKERGMAKWDAVSWKFTFFKSVAFLGKLFVNSFFFLVQGENPIFKSATSTYKNPTYNGK